MHFLVFAVRLPCDRRNWHAAFAGSCDVGCRITDHQNLIRLKRVPPYNFSNPVPGRLEMIDIIPGYDNIEILLNTKFV